MRFPTVTPLTISHGLISCGIAMETIGVIVTYLYQRESSRPAMDGLYTTTAGASLAILGTISLFLTNINDLVDIMSMLLYTAGSIFICLGISIHYEPSLLSNGGSPVIFDCIGASLLAARISWDLYFYVKGEKEWHLLLQHEAAKFLFWGGAVLHFAGVGYTFQSYVDHVYSGTTHVNGLMFVFTGCALMFIAVGWFAYLAEFRNILVTRGIGTLALTCICFAGILHLHNFYINSPASAFIWSFYGIGIAGALITAARFMLGCHQREIPTAFEVSSEFSLAFDDRDEMFIL